MVLLFVYLQVRCAAVFALGTFVGNSAERTDHSTTIDHNVAMMLAQLINDGSPVVRKVSLKQLYMKYIKVIRYYQYSLLKIMKGTLNRHTVKPS